MCSGCWSRYNDRDQGYEIPVEIECKNCEDKEGKIDTAKEFLTSVVHRLYSKDTLDVCELENDLDELCYALGVELLPGELQIQRKVEKKENVLEIFKPIEEWKEFNNTYLNQFTR
jgi:ATP-dependent RNA circularization protein (DNA/RNA ligase family)